MEKVYLEEQLSDIDWKISALNANHSERRAWNSVAMICIDNTEDYYYTLSDLKQIVAALNKVIHDVSEEKEFEELTKAYR